MGSGHVREAVEKCDHNAGTPNVVKQQKSK